MSLPLVVSHTFLLWYAPKAMAAAMPAFTVNNVAWIPMWGLGTAVTAIVGQQLGRNRAELAARATWTALAIARWPTWGPWPCAM